MTLIALLSACSLSYGAAQWWHHRRLQALSQAEENEEERKKRPYTDSHSPDQHKRLRTAVPDTDAPDLGGIEPLKPAGCRRFPHSDTKFKPLRGLLNEVEPLQA